MYIPLMLGRPVVLLVFYLVALGCSERTRNARVGRPSWWGGETPDILPQMTNDELPFRYPVALYLQRVEGNVLLRLFVDSTGRVLSDSTRVLEPSGYAGLDSAALAGASRLGFRPARRRGVPIAVALLYPVHFRHPEGASSSTKGTAPRDSL